MFIGIQFPLIDSRKFIPGRTYKLKRPVWDMPEAGREFVRYFGILEYPRPKRPGRKKKGKVESSYLKRIRRSVKSKFYLNTEGTYSKADRAIGFPSLVERKKIGSPENPFFTFCIFRRLFSDGKITSKVEIGFRDADIDDPNRKKTIPTIDLKAIIDDLLRMPISVPRTDSDDSSVQLQNVGRKLAAHFLHSTTKMVHKKLPEIEKWWVEDGNPMIYIELESDIEIKPFDDNLSVETVKLEKGFELLYFIYGDLPRPIKIWILKNGTEIDKDYRLRIRLNIFRVNAESETLRQILRNIYLERIKPERNHPASEDLINYLENSLKFLNIKMLYGIPQHEIQKILLDTMYTEYQYNTLMSKLKEVSAGVEKKLRLLPAPSTPITPSPHSPGKKKVFISYNHKDIEFVNKIKSELEKAGFHIIIDSDSMEIGDEIPAFIAESITRSEFTLSIISRNSLKSAWVIVESLETLMYEKVEKKKRLIPIFIDDSFLRRESRSEIVDDIEKRLKTINDEIAHLAEEGKLLGRDDIISEGNRLRELRNNIGKIFKKLNESLGGDFSSNEKFSQNLPRLINVLRGETG